MDLEKIEIGFRKSLNSHGHGFKSAALKLINDNKFPGSNWRVVATELSVEVRGRDTRIDLIVQKGSSPIYLVIECKRTNPSLSNWCFAKAKWPHTDRIGTQTYFETIKRDIHGRVKSEMVQVLDTDRDYQIGLEVRSDPPNEKSKERKEESESAKNQHNGGRGAIEEAMGQVCRGFNGFINFLSAREELFPRDSEIKLIPVIFTTANIFATEKDISDAKIDSGNICLDLKPIKKEWIWLDYPQSLGIKHDVPCRVDRNTISQVFFDEFLRRIAIVSGNGIVDFLNSGIWTAI